MRLCLALLVTLVWSSSVQAKTYVVSVGNNLGKGAEPLLRFAEQDAQSFASVLRRLGRVSGENTVLLLGEDASTLRGTLLRTNARLRSAQANQTPNDALIIYYSGHADATGLHLGESTLPFEELKTIVESSPARVRVLIVDSCRSGGIIRIKGVRPSGSFAIRLDDRLDAEGMAIITSSAGSEDSQESETLKASFFTHHLVNALRGAADRDQDARVTLNEAYSYAYKETLRSTGRTLNIQHPTYLYDIKGKGDFALTYLTEGLKRSGKLGLPEAGAYLIMEGSANGPMVAEVSVEQEGAQLLLKPGRYFVQRRSENHYREYELELERGGSVDLSSVEYEELTYSQLLRKGGGTRKAVHTLSVLGAARGPILEGHQVAPGIALGYSLDLPWLSLGFLARWSLSGAQAQSGDLQTTHHELGLRLKAERFIDLAWLSVSLGLLVEGLFHRQLFQSAGVAPDRSSWAFGFGGFVAVERSLFSSLVLRLEGGPISQVFSRAVTRGGEAIDQKLETPLTWWAAGGIGWRF